MKIVNISDTHGRHLRMGELPDGDILVHAGDVSNVGGEAEVLAFIKWLVQMSLRYRYIVWVAGNHDKCFDVKFSYEFATFGDHIPRKVRPKWLTKALEELPDNVHYLENSSVEIEGVKFWGSPATPWFHGEFWGHNYHRGDNINKLWKTIPDDTDVIITHGPVATKLDYVPSSGFYAGCEQLRKRVKEIKPLIHVCGHIHEGHGITNDENTVYINAAILDMMYEPTNKPIVVNIDKEHRTAEIEF